MSQTPRPLGERIAALESRIEDHNTRLDKHDEKFEKHDDKFDALDRFKATLLGGAAVMGVLVGVLVDWLKKQLHIG